eukprot:Hpha_TRINITY_DN36473_c0_g1::TRINITY_DN36473_c0_g1_i1::g.20071::m.20071
MLEAAIDGGHAGAVRQLIAKDPSIVNTTSRGRMPLHLACARGSLPITELLLTLGADLGARTEDTKETPVALAARAGSEALVRALLTRGAEADTQGGRAVHWATPLFAAAQAGYLGVCKALLEAGARAGRALQG